MAVHKNRRWLRLFTALFALTLFAAACGDDSSTSDTTPEDEAADDETADDEAAADDEAPEDEPSTAPEKSEISVGIIPIADVAPIYIGIQQGFFEAEGLTLAEPQFNQGGAAAIPTLISGDIDFAFGAYPSFFGAVSQGQELLITTEANRAAPLFGGLYSLPDSGIDTPADLTGATIAVNTLDNLVQLAVEAQLQAVGLELSDVQLVEIPFPEMVAALELGNVDVISVVEPFGTRAKNNLDAHLVVDMFAGDIAGFPVAGFYVTSSFAADNPNTVAAFNRGFAAAVEYGNTVDDALETAMTTYIGEDLTVEAFAGLNLPLFVSGFDADFIQTVPDYMLESGLLDEALDAAEHAVS